MHPFASVLAVCLCAGAVLCAPASRGDDLVGIEFTSGRAYRIPTDGSAPSVIGETGLNTVSSLERLADGNYYGFTVGTDALYRFDPTTFAPTLLGPISTPHNLFEGSIAQSPSGTVYITNGGDAATDYLLTLDLATRIATPVGTIRAGEADINGMAWRSDGVLVALDRGSNSLVTINPSTGAATQLRSLPFPVGGSGGMTLVGPVGYLVTGAGGSIAGSNSLYSFDPFTGQTTLVRNLAPDVGDVGIGGLAVLVPEPVAALPMIAALVIALRRVRRQPPGLWRVIR
jgi:hypothetical protein